MWAASFAIPFWAEPMRHGQAVVWIGDAEIVVPFPREEALVSPAGPQVAQPPADAQPGLEVEADAEIKTEVEVELDPSRRDPGVPDSEPDPAAVLRRELALVQSELDARSARVSALDGVQRELRADLAQLIQAIAGQREEFERRLAAADAEREELEARISAGDALRSELEERIGAAEVHRAGLDERVEAADAEREQLAQRMSQGEAARTQLGRRAAEAEVTRDAALGEAAALRGELERIGTELVVVRDRMIAQGGNLGEAERLLADALSLSAEFRSGSSQIATF
jgi:chromosome segregation ATPase